MFNYRCNQQQQIQQNRQVKQEQQRVTSIRVEDVLGELVDQHNMKPY